MLYRNVKIDDKICTLCYSDLKMINMKDNSCWPNSQCRNQSSIDTITVIIVFFNIFLFELQKDRFKDKIHTMLLI
jgi:hypothetical protein